MSAYSPTENPPAKIRAKLRMTRCYVPFVVIPLTTLFDSLNRKALTQQTIICSVIHPLYFRYYW
jgi:hypothetical protein